jgi:polar amino acid transport system permease protein
MFERLLQDAPQFFAASNLLFIAQAMGRTLVMTLVGCGVGMVFGLLIAVVRFSTTPLLMPVRALLVLYVETFRRIPFLA